MLDEQFTLIKEPKDTQAKNISIMHSCNGCKKQVDKIYQQGLCKSCLSLAFRRLVKIIDSVRK
jgi:rRNA maturation endonuclease Nob1